MCKTGSLCSFENKVEEGCGGRRRGVCGGEEGMGRRRDTSWEAFERNAGLKKKKKKERNAGCSSEMVAVEIVRSGGILDLF